MKVGAVFVLCAVLAGLWPAGARAGSLICTVNPYPPYVSPRLPNGGWFWRVVKEAFARKGYDAEIEFRTWVHAMENVETGKRDCLVAVVKTPERERTFLYSDAVGSVKTGFFKLRSRGDIVFTGDLKGLAKLTIGYVDGFAMSPEFDAAAFLNKKAVGDSIVGLRELYNGRLDLFAGTEAVDVYKIKRQIAPNPMFRGAEEKLVFIAPPLAVSDLYIAVLRTRPDAEKVIADFNAGLASLREDGEYERIRNP